MSAEPAMRCFLINLARSPDRLAAMVPQLSALSAALGIEWERVDAIDGTTLQLPNPALVDQDAFRRRHHALLRRGEVGCYLSHHATLTRFLATDDEIGLILEDDAILSAALPGVLGALSACPGHWDLVKLHATHPSGIIPRLRLDGRHRVVSLAFRHGSAAAYVVNRRAAERLVARLLPASGVEQPPNCMARTNRAAAHSPHSADCLAIWRSRKPRGSRPSARRRRSCRRAR